MIAADEFCESWICLCSYIAPYSVEDKEVVNSSSSNICLLSWTGSVSILGYSSYRDDDPLHLLPPLSLLKDWGPSSSLSLSSASLGHCNFYSGTQTGQ